MIYEKPRLIILAAHTQDAEGTCETGISNPDPADPGCKVGVHAPNAICQTGNGPDTTTHPCLDGNSPGSGTLHCGAGGNASGASPACKLGGGANPACSEGYTPIGGCSGGHVGA
jgi:hypothetical protein